MKHILFSAFLIIALFATAQQTGNFGAKITPDGAISMTELHKKMGKKMELSPVKVKAPITAVCKKKGCWMTLKDEKGQDVRITFKDYAFFMPLDCTGKTATIEGKAYINVTPVEELRHYAVDGGMTEADAKKKFKKPSKELTFEATGVIIE